MYFVFIYVSVCDQSYIYVIFVLHLSIVLVRHGRSHIESLYNNMSKMTDDDPLSHNMTGHLDRKSQLMYVLPLNVWMITRADHNNRRSDPIRGRR